MDVPLFLKSNQYHSDANFYLPKQTNTFFNYVKGKVHGALPTIGENIVAKKNLARIMEILGEVETPKILIVGVGEGGEGEYILSGHPENFIIRTDIVYSKKVDVLCDAHDLPFSDESFDVVVIQAVLEHVIDPFKCVEEIHRVLKLGGIVYAETPFMQQVHLGRYDFMRFTHVGHRGLFRKFEEIESGVVGGPGMALAWSIKYFFATLAGNFKPMGWLLEIALPFFTFYLKYIDRLLIQKPGSLDAASGFFFLGFKSEITLSDLEVCKTYRGLMKFT
jgi:SAM-dependent methyltransferase